MNRFTIFSIVLMAIALTGCQSKSKQSAPPGKPVTLGPQYSEKKGLLVREETRESLGVKITEVIEQTVTSTLEIPMRTYQVTATGALASGMVTPEQAQRLKVGTQVDAKVRGEGSVTGIVTSLSDTLQNATGMIEVLAEIPTGAKPLTIGEFLNASVTVESPDKVVTVPRSALLQCGDGYSVYTVSGEHLVRTPVKVGAVSADVAEIQDGLYTGDEVVSQAVMPLWMTELAAVKGGQACCVPPPKGK